MRITIHRAGERGKGEHGWLHTRYSFSFANYYNPKKMDFGALRVLNEDIVEQGKGFGSHGHDNMEIITIVLEGILRHEDSMGNKGLIPAGDVQRMSAGTGVIHSEYNHSKTEKVHLLQIWVIPNEQDINPEYEQQSFPKKDRKNKLQLIVSVKKDKNALHLHQDAYFYLASLEKGKGITYTVHKSGHGVYIFIIKGTLKIGNEVLKDSDAAEVTETREVTFIAEQPTEVLVIEVPL